MRKELSYWVMWGLIIFGLSTIAICLMVSRSHAAVYFNPVPNTLVNGTTGLSAQVNADYNQIVTDGNAANTNLLAQIAALGPGGLPAGAVVMFTSSCPAGFALADGLQGRPDARGLYIRGLDNQVGRDPNRVLGSYQADQIQNHFHSLSSLSITASFSSVGFNSTPSGSRFLPSTALGQVTSIMNGGLGLSETRPTTIVLNYCLPKPITNSGLVSPFNPPPQVLSNLIAPDANIMMIDFNRIISDGNTAFNAVQALITASGAITAIPPGAVVPFNLAVCPSGWITADGTGGTVDMRARFARVTQGSPAVGTVQGDQFIDHTHTLPSLLTGIFGTSQAGGTPSQATINSLNFDAAITNATGANIGTETRPKNVALLYCQKS